MFHHHALFYLGIAGATSSRMKIAAFELNMASVTSHIFSVDKLRLRHNTKSIPTAQAKRTVLESDCLDLNATAPAEKEGRSPLCYTEVYQGDLVTGVKSTTHQYFFFFSSSSQKLL